MVLKLGDMTDITANWKRIVPGSVYFDFTQKTSRKELMQAFKNGASLIYTEKNISDPRIPVIKTNNLNSTFIKLLVQNCGQPIDDFVFIAVTGSKGKKTVSRMLECIFYNGLNIKCNYFRTDSSLDFVKTQRIKSALYIESIFKSLKGYKDNNIKFIPIIADINDGFDYAGMLNYNSIINTNITTEDDMQKGEEKFHGFQELYDSMNDIKAIILNIDDPHSLRAINNANGVVAITYGLNKKAAITATSIDLGEKINFNFCLQRSMITSSGKKVEPFETPFRLKALGNYNIYNALASITCALYYDFDIDMISKSLDSFNGLHRSFEKIEVNGFTMIDHLCKNFADYSTAFESLQTLNYKNLFILISVNPEIDLESNKRIAYSICEWALALKAKKVNVTGSMEWRSKYEADTKKEGRLFKKYLRANHISNDYFDNLDEAIIDIIDEISEGDMLLLLGGEELDKAQSIIYNIFNKKR